MAIFDETGNLITKKPESDKVIPEKEVFCCQYCDEEWDTKRSKGQHERWCDKNPNQRGYRKTGKEVKKQEKESQIKSKIRKPKGISIIEELRNFDKILGLTDEQIVKYIREKMKD